MSSDFYAYTNSGNLHFGALTSLHVAYDQHSSPYGSKSKSKPLTLTLTLTQYLTNAVSSMAAFALFLDGTRLRPSWRHLHYNLSLYTPARLMRQK
jgi:hypothetical protein